MNGARRKAKVDSLALGELCAGAGADDCGRVPDRDRNVLVGADRLDQLDRCGNGALRLAGDKLDVLRSHAEGDLAIGGVHPAGVGQIDVYSTLESAAGGV